MIHVSLDVHLVFFIVCTSLSLGLLDISSDVHFFYTIHSSLSRRAIVFILFMHLSPGLLDLPLDVHAYYLYYMMIICQPCVNQVTTDVQTCLRAHTMIRPHTANATQAHM